MFRIVISVTLRKRISKLNAFFFLIQSWHFKTEMFSAVLVMKNRRTNVFFNLLPVGLWRFWERVASCLSSMGLREVELGAWALLLSDVSVVKPPLHPTLKHQVHITNYESTIWGHFSGIRTKQFSTPLTLPGLLSVLMSIDLCCWPLSPNSCYFLLAGSAAQPEHCVKGMHPSCFGPWVSK